ncbi:protein-disulfide reductase DsbD domain-containing protein [Paracoccus sp. (in: a-proteobacteria)]|uniref:protein-disulfide reductase DsbD domain-containing protein n=1 Tax=Paracoccus sp. TaxID=267 RepID=UPI0026DF0205|nr:protein-disulfide reductase DsbD domain-containing protein [Paracoccus sp. (in: a-proteobacteria)]MDO5647002.1 protein-disulfide reductase DsbD family protein [Paracoccus sp. (in: a-proteobacteria)]
MRYFALIPALMMPLSVAAQELPPGLAGARLLPGWVDAAGNRITALQLDLEPGWKTYWRSPGDTGLPPHFDWEGSENLGAVALHWPAPQAIESGGAVEPGYHDRLVLPMTVTPADPGQPVQIAAQIDLGLCENICVPAFLTLTAPAPGGHDPVIQAAMDAVPQRLDDAPDCAVTDLSDGLRLSVALPGPAILAAVELDGHPDVWVSGAELDDGRAVVDMVGPTAAPFDLPREQVRVTVLSDDGTAVESWGCAG